MNKHTLITLFSTVALLSACGGGSDAPPPPPPPAATDAVPDTASASTLGLRNYLVELSAMPVETKEPVDLSSFAPKTADDAEPDAVD